MPLNMEANGPVTMFICYSHADHRFRGSLENHLKGMQRNGMIVTWHDRKITAGMEWRGQIDEHLESARLILLLISADFLASDYCFDVEVKRALERHDSGEACVIPVILRPCDWRLMPFSNFKPFPQIPGR